MNNKNCKNCFSAKLGALKDFPIEDVETFKITHINGFKCRICGCVHIVEDNEVISWEYVVNNEINTTSAIGNWATDQNIKTKKLEAEYV